MTGAPPRSQSACHCQQPPALTKESRGHRLAPHGIASLARNYVGSSRFLDQDARKRTPLPIGAIPPSDGDRHRDRAVRRGNL